MQAHGARLVGLYGLVPVVGICTFPERANGAQRLLGRAELARDVATRVRERVHVYLSYRTSRPVPAAVGF